MQKDFREWRGKVLSNLNGDYRILTERAEQNAPTDRETPFPQGFVQAYNDRTLVEYYIGLLETAPRETQINLYLHDRAAIAALDDRINGCGQQRTSVREKLEKKKNLLKAQRDKDANQQQRAAI